MKLTKDYIKKGAIIGVDSSMKYLYSIQQSEDKGWTWNNVDGSTMYDSIKETEKVMKMVAKVRNSGDPIRMVQWQPFIAKEYKA